MTTTALPVGTRTPPVGAYHGVPESTYHTWDLASASRLRILDSSTPLHVRHACDFPESQDTPAKQLGRAAHCLVLEPHRYEDRFGVAPECDRRTREGKRIWVEFSAINEGKELLRSSVGDSAQIIAENVREHPAAAAIFAKADMREISLVSDIFGVRFKARVDAYGEGLVVDLKTTPNAGRDSFEKSIMNFGYGIQAAAYMRAMHAHGFEVRDFVFVCVESDPPHAVAVYRLEDEIVELFDARLPELLKRYDDCARTRRWPGYSSGVQSIGVPAWYARRIESEANQ